MADQPDNPQSPGHSFAIWGLLVTVAPTISYIYAYAYEAGYCNFWGIPRELIRLDLTRIVLCFGAITSVLLVALFFVNLTIMLMAGTNLHHPIWRSMFRLAAPALVVILLIYGYGISSSMTILGTALFVMILVAEFILPLRNEGPSYGKQLIEQEKIEADTPDIFLWLLRRFGLRTYLVGASLLLGVLVAEMSGSASARMERSFLVIDRPTEHVVLRIYGDCGVIAAVDIQSKFVYPEFRMIKISELQEPMLLKPIGPLKPWHR